MWEFLSWGPHDDFDSAGVPEPLEARIHLKGNRLTCGIKSGAGRDSRWIIFPLKEARELRPGYFQTESRFGIPALVNAGGEGDLKTVLELLEKGADVNTRAENGCSALISATLFGHAEVVKTLLARGADVETKVGGETALMLAAEFGYLEIVELLLSAGADVNARNEIEMWIGTALEHAEHGTHLRSLTPRPYDRIVEVLKQAGAKDRYS